MHYITLYNRPAISRHKEKFTSIWVPVQDGYPVAVHEGDGGPQVRCADVPEMVCAGDTVEAALFGAVDALGSALSFYVDQRIAIPLPSPAAPGQLGRRLKHRTVGGYSFVGRGRFTLSTSKTKEPTKACFSWFQKH